VPTLDRRSSGAAATVGVDAAEAAPAPAARVSAVAARGDVLDLRAGMRPRPAATAAAGAAGPAPAAATAAAGRVVDVAIGERLAAVVRILEAAIHERVDGLDSRDLVLHEDRMLTGLLALRLGPPLRGLRLGDGGVGGLDGRQGSLGALVVDVVVQLVVVVDALLEAAEGVGTRGGRPDQEARHPAQGNRGAGGPHDGAARHPAVDNADRRVPTLVLAARGPAGQAVQPAWLGGAHRITRANWAASCW